MLNNSTCGMFKNNKTSKKKEEEESKNQKRKQKTMTSFVSRKNINKI